MDYYFCLCNSELGWDNIIGIFSSEEEAQKALKYELNNDDRYYYILSSPFYKDFNQYIEDVF